MRLVARVLPSLVAASAGVLAAGLLEAAHHASGVVTAGAGVGFLALAVVPPLCVVSLGVRALWGRWRAAARESVEESGAAPRLAAWLAYAGVSLAILGGLTFRLVHAVASRSTTPGVVALAAAIIVSAIASLLVAASRPIVDAMARGLAAIDRAFHAKRGTHLLTPVRIVVAVLSLMAFGLTLTFWLVVQPNVGTTDPFLLAYPGVLIAVVVVVHVIWQRVSRWRPAAIAMTVLFVGGAVVSGGAAVWAGVARPDVVLDVWAREPVAGAVADLVVDLDAVRSQLADATIRPPERTGAPHPDVILITIDTLRADKTPPYGGFAVMPAFAKLAREGVVFERAYSPGNVTRRSLPTIVTGLHPTRVRGRVAGWALKLDPRHVTLAQRFQAAGYETAGFFCCRSQFGPEHEIGLERGFEHIEIEREAATSSERLQAWLAERRPPGKRKPVFVWMHLFEPHVWEALFPVAKYGSGANERYYLALTRVDKALKPLFALLDDRERRGHTVILVSADHGEGLGDHGVKNHSVSLYDSETHVPLVVKAPGIAPVRIARPVGLVSVAATLLDLAGFEPPAPPQLDGESLAPILRGQTSAALDGVAYSYVVKDRSTRNAMRAVVSGRYKLILTDGDKSELYDLVDDPGEQKDIAHEQPAIVRELRKLLDERSKLDKQPPF